CGRIGKVLAGAAIVTLAIVVALAVGAAAEPGLGEYTVLDFALFLECDFVFENIEFRRQMRRHLAAESGLPLGVACLHIPYTTSEWGCIGNFISSRYRARCLRPRCFQSNCITIDLAARARRVRSGGFSSKRATASAKLSASSAIQIFVPCSSPR